MAEASRQYASAIYLGSLGMLIGQAHAVVEENG
jgi:hypothetical protein